MSNSKKDPKKESKLIKEVDNFGSLKTDKKPNNKNDKKSDKPAKAEKFL